MEQLVKAFEDEKKTVRTICAEAGERHIEALRALDGRGSVRLFDKSQVLPLLQDLSAMGITLVIVENQGSVFEMKCAFPKGQLGHGYYNLQQGGETGLSGHIDINHITHAAAVSEMFFKMESKSWWFIHENGDVVFKVFVGRKKDRSLNEDHLALFNKWLNE